MFLRLVGESFLRQKRRKLLAGIAIALGVCVATAMIAVATDIGDKISRELRSYGANLVVTPQQDGLAVQIAGVDLKPPGSRAYLNEADLLKIKGIFWHNNIVGYAPMLSVNVLLEPGQTDVTMLGTYFSRRVKFGVENFTTGVRVTNPWWKVKGAWPGDDSENVLLGERLASKFGKEPDNEIEINGWPHRISGILSTGGPEDDQIVAPLPLSQSILGKPGAVDRIYVSAITKPEDAFARRDPRSLSPEVYDRWYCSPYARSIAYQLEEAIPHSHAEPIRQIAQNEGVVLSRIKGLMLLVTLAALIASALAVSAAMATSVFERRGEVGLMKALGAGNLSVAGLFLAEAVLLAVLGGIAGLAGGSLLAHQIGRSVFGSTISIQPVSGALILLVGIVVTFAGSGVAIRRAVISDPALALRGEP
ncbi:MAG: ABC transporter permease [Acidobacteriales bacterium]|nr:ABC transporter permease [Terriglobales bacterium]